MTINFGNVDASSVLYIPFQTFNSAGASVTLTGLAVTDIEIYKNGSTTQRSSDNGYVLLDTDGIDFDGITGIHGFSVDLSDNTDAGFYAAGSFYWVVISAVTIDSQTVNFIAATFRIGPQAANMTQILGTAVSTPATSGILDVNVKNIDNDAASASGTVTFPNATLASTANITAGTITTVTNLTNAPTAGDFTSTMKTSIGTAVAASAVASVTGNVGGNVTGSVGSVVGAVGSVTAGVTVTTNNDKTGYALTSGERTSVADALLNRDMSAVTDSTARSPLNALRILRNKVDVTTGTVYKENDSTSAWTFTNTTDAAALPITGVDPT